MQAPSCNEKPTVVAASANVVELREPSDHARVRQIRCMQWCLKPRTKRQKLTEWNETKRKRLSSLRRQGRNRCSKTETSFGFRFRCANGLHETGFYANAQWGVSPHVSLVTCITIILHLLFNENQKDVLWNDVRNSTMHDCFITQNCQTFFSQLLI